MAGAGYRSDDCFVNEKLEDPNLRQLDQYDIQTTNIYLTGIWQDSYEGIHRANVAIQKIPDIKMDENLKSRLVGEANFLRALFYFNLVRLFGDVPLVEVPVRILMIIFFRAPPKTYIPGDHS